MKQDTLEGKAKTKNGIKRLCFSIICILLEVIFIITIVTRLNEYAEIINLFTRILSGILVLRLYASDKTSSMKMPWVILILIFPIMGVGLYLLIGSPVQGPHLALLALVIDFINVLDFNEHGAPPLIAHALVGLPVGKHHSSGLDPLLNLRIVVVGDTGGHRHRPEALVGGWHLVLHIRGSALLGHICLRQINGVVRLGVGLDKDHGINLAVDIGDPLDALMH